MDGVTGPVDRVVVVGAGIAGLATSSALREAGVACVVLEARDRIGGRLHTVDLAGVPVDLGGSWIHHPVGNPLSALCDDHGIARDPGDPMPSLVAYDRVEERRLSRAEVETSLREVFDAFEQAVPTIRDRLKPGATAVDAVEAFIVERGFVGGWRDGRAKDFSPRSRRTPVTRPSANPFAGTATQSSTAASSSAICQGAVTDRWSRPWQPDST